MNLDPSEWQLALHDPATNYDIHDHALGCIEHPTEANQDQPLLLLDAVHIETGVRIRITARIPPNVVPHLLGELRLLHDDLRARGAIT